MARRNLSTFALIFNFAVLLLLSSDAKTRRSDRCCLELREPKCSLFGRRWLMAKKKTKAKQRRNNMQLHLTCCSLPSRLCCCFLNWNKTGIDKTRLGDSSEKKSPGVAPKIGCHSLPIVRCNISCSRINKGNDLEAHEASDHANFSITRETLELCSVIRHECPPNIKYLLLPSHEMSLNGKCFTRLDLNQMASLQPFSPFPSESALPALGSTQHTLQIDVPLKTGSKRGNGYRCSFSADTFFHSSRFYFPRCVSKASLLNLLLCLACSILRLIGFSWTRATTVCRPWMEENV